MWTYGWTKYDIVSGERVSFSHEFSTDLSSADRQLLRQTAPQRDRQLLRQTDSSSDRQLLRQTDSSSVRQTTHQTNRQLLRQTDSSSDRQTAPQTDRQLIRHTWLWGHPRLSEDGNLILCQQNHLSLSELNEILQPIAALYIYIHE